MSAEAAAPSQDEGGCEHPTDQEACMAPLSSGGLCILCLRDRGERRLSRRGLRAIDRGKRSSRRLLLHDSSHHHGGRRWPEVVTKRFRKLAAGRLEGAIGLMPRYGSEVMIHGAECKGPSSLNLFTINATNEGGPLPVSAGNGDSMGVCYAAIALF